MKSLFERVALQLQLNLPFVIFRKPNSKTLIGIFQKDDHLYFLENYSDRGFVFAPFQGNPVYFPLDKSEVKYNTIYFSSDFEAHPVEEIQQEEARIAYEKLVVLGVETIKEGIFNKVVLSRKEEVSFAEIAWESTFERVLYQYPSAFCYFWFHPKVGKWMGATPEKLVQAKEYSFKTMALAGTQAYQENAEVIWRSKEKKEQEFVTDFIVNQLKKKTKEVTVSEPYTSRAGNLVHLKTDIEGMLEPGASLESIINVLHPTPAVCGFPKDLTQAFILENEGYDREFYTGYLGEINYEHATHDTATDLYVNLRCMKLSKEHATLFVGCGVTKDSKPHEEWQETVHKTKTMKQIL